jgi:hypothetical protein
LIQDIKDQIYLSNNIIKDPDSKKKKENLEEVPI